MMLLVGVGNKRPCAFLWVVQCSFYDESTSTNSDFFNRLLSCATQTFQLM